MGSQGELKAAEYLKTHGFTVLDTNVRYGNEEVDIIAMDVQLNELVFVEVKTRKTDFFGDPSAAVGYKKMRSLEKVAALYRKEKKIWNDFRFDIIAVLPSSIEHYPNISWEMVK